MLDKIRLTVLVLLGVMCITGYLVSFSGPSKDAEINRNLAAEDELDLIDTEK